MRTKEEYMKDLGRMKKNLFYDGEKIDRLDERQMACINTIGITFDLAEDPDLKQFFVRLRDEVAFHAQFLEGEYEKLEKKLEDSE